MVEYILTNNEIKNINKYYNKRNIIKDEIVKLRNANLQKLQPWTRVNYKKKKKQHNNYVCKDIEHKIDPYKFKEIPKDIKNIIENLLIKYNIGLSTLSFKCNIKYNILYNYINKNEILDNLDLHTILKYFNYDLDNKLIKSYKTNKTEYMYNNIDLENINLNNLQAIDLEDIDIERI